MKTDPNCIFCKIVAGEIPAQKVYEDDNVLAFLDIEPVNPGHSLVIPKEHIDHLHQVPDDTYQQVMSAVKKLSSQIMSKLNPKRVGLMVHGFEVPHAHVHLVPMHNAGDLRVGHKSPASSDELDKIAQAIKVN